MTNNNDKTEEGTQSPPPGEERLCDKPVQTPTADTLKSMQRLLRQQQRQQNELQTQNQELRQAWAENEAGLERYTDLYDFAPVAYLRVGKHADILDVNLEGASMLGKQRDVLLKTPLTQFVAEEDRPAFTAFLRLVQTKAARQAREFRLVRSEQTIHVLVEAMSSRSEDSDQTGENEAECRLIIVDISEQKKAVESLRQVEAIYRTLVDNTDLGITLVDTNHTILRTNLAQARLLGKEPTDLVGKKCFHEFEHRKQVCEHCPGVEAMASRRHAESEFVGVRDDGSRVVAKIRACPWLDADGKALGFIELVEDITDRKRLEKQIEEFAVAIASKNEELKERTMAMEAATRAKDDFLANMSYELRTPLNAIIGFSAGLLERIHRHPLNDHQQSRLHAIKNSGQHLLMLINGILDLAKMESGKVQLNPTTFDMFALADEIRETAESLLKDKPDVHFTLRIEKHMPMVTSDRDKVRQILTNVINNAVKFTKQGSINLCIRRQGPSLIMEIEDTGIGIPKKYVARVFDRFLQVPSTGDRELKGSGLGLAISNAYARLLGGTISLQSVEGQGTRLTVVLPLLPGNGYQPEVRDVEELTRAMHASPPSTTPSAKVLCIEANEASMMVLRDDLTEAGYQVVPTAKGSEAVSLAIEEQPQLIILDLVLPEVDGWQILHNLKTNPATRDIPVVIVTSLDEQRLAMSLGANDYLRKPVERTRLLNSVHQLLSTANCGAPNVTDEDLATVADVPQAVGN